MEQQKVFATAWRGFEKQAVLDYIYEQDVLSQKKEAELSAKLADCESKLETLPPCEEDESASMQNRIEELEQECAQEQETARSLQERCDRLRREADQFIQAVRSKEGELQLQMELNRQLQQKCDTLESKLKTVAERLMAEREATVHITSPRVTVVEAKQNPPTDFQSAPVEEAVDSADQVTDLKGEISDFRQSVSKTLLDFEAALAKLEGDKSDELIPGEGSAFFH